MNDRDREHFDRERLRIKENIKKAKLHNSDNLADLQADLMELDNDESIHKFYDSLEE